MELTYQSPLMPASYTALSADEMTYIDGGAIQIGSYLIEFHPEALLQSVVNFTVNFGQLMGKAALGTAVGGLIQGCSDSVPVGLLLLGWPEQGRQSCHCGGRRSRWLVRRNAGYPDL